MNKLLITSIMVFVPFFLAAQTQTKRDRIWVISDSTGIDFTDLNNIVPFNSNIVGSPATPNQSTYNCASICDSSGNLIFYSNSRNFWGSDNNLLLNSDTILNGFPNNTSFFLPSRIDTLKYSFFETHSINVLNNVQYSTFNRNLNNNGQLVSFQQMYVGGYFGSTNLCAIKHGNGVDWWILFFSRDNSQYTSMLLIQDSIINQVNYNLDSVFTILPSSNATSLSKIDVSNDGSKITQAFNNNDTIDVCIYDFDRCTGILSFNKRIFYRPDACQTQANFWWVIRETVFSNDNQFVYAMTWDTIYQLSTTRDWTQQTPLVIWYDTNHVDFDDYIIMRSMQRAPDGRIYVARKYSLMFPQGPDSVTYYLGVLDSIDYSYPTAHFTRKGFYLGGRKSYGGLVSAPNYDLGPLVGSPCDTLSSSTGLNENPAKPKITLFPNPAQTEATLTWSGMQDGTFVLRDMLGRALLQQELNTSSGSIKLNLSEFSKGIYLWQEQSKEHAQNGKLVVD